MNIFSLLFTANPGFSPFKDKQSYQTSENIINIDSLYFVNITSLVSREIKVKLNIFNTALSQNYDISKYFLPVEGLIIT